MYVCVYVFIDRQIDKDPQQGFVPCPQPSPGLSLASQHHGHMSMHLMCTGWPGNKTLPYNVAPSTAEH